MEKKKFSDKDHIFMNEAIKQAQLALERDEVPIGAVITYQNKMIAKAHNQVEMLNDPTAHAEMIAITQAASALSCKWLYNCSIYVTIEPCSMCAGALVLARIKNLVFGVSDPKAGACGSVLNVVRCNHLNHRMDIQKGILSIDCGDLLRDFFSLKRKMQKKDV